jgi:hypothetical protein
MPQVDLKSANGPKVTDELRAEVVTIIIVTPGATDAGSFYALGERWLDQLRGMLPALRPGSVVFARCYSDDSERYQWRHEVHVPRAPHATKRGERSNVPLARESALLRRAETSRR